MSAKDKFAKIFATAILESFDFNEIDNNQNADFGITEMVNERIKEKLSNYLKTNYKINLPFDDILYIKPFKVNNDTWYAILFTDDIVYGGVMLRIDIFKFTPLRVAIKYEPKIMKQINDANRIVAPVMKAFEEQILNKSTYNIEYVTNKSNPYCKKLDYTGSLSKIDESTIIISDTNATIDYDELIEKGLITHDDYDIDDNLEVTIKGLLVKSSAIF